jgi:hypothetical protein
VRKIFAAALACAAITPALAEHPHSYRYVEGGWFDRTAEWDLEAGMPKDEVEADGWSIAGSFRTDGGALFQGYYSEGDIDKAWGAKPSEIGNLLGVGVDFEVRSWGVLVGGASYINDRTSAWAGFGYGRDELKLKFKGLFTEDYDIDQFSFGGGVRYTPIQMLEVNGGARLVHFRADETDLLDDYRDTDVEVTIGARFQPVRLVSIGASYARQLDAESEIIRADVRLQF